MSKDNQILDRKTVMPRYIVFANRKGGCGKTTTSVNVAHALAKRKNKVLLLDLDPQAHATLSLNISPDAVQSSIFHLLNGLQTLENSIVTTNISGLDLVPSSRDLVSIEMDKTRFDGDETSLAEKLTSLNNSYDYVILDPPPAVSTLSLSALIAAKEVFIPMPMHFLAMEGLAEMIRLIYTINATVNPALRLSGIVPTFFNKQTRISQEIMGDIKRNFGEDILFPGIRMNVSIAEAPGHGKSILQYSPNSNGAKDYQTLANHIDVNTQRS